jgi:negative regulator of sigma E activity
MNQVEHNSKTQMDCISENGSEHHLPLTDEQALSALMDGELGEFELRRLLARIAASPELQRTWERYNLARAVFEPEPLDLRSAATSLTTESSEKLLDRIMLAVSQEPLESGSNVRNAITKPVQNKPWLHGLARLAIAASVALAVFVSMQSQLLSPAGQPEVADAGAASQPSERTTLETQNVQLAVDEAAQQRLNDYIRSVSIPGRTETPTPFNILEESSMLRPVSDRELIEEVERSNP